MEQKTIDELVATLNIEFNADVFEHLVRRFKPLFKKYMNKAPWFDF